MRVEKRDNSRETRVLAGMAVNARVLGRIASKWEEGMFASTWANIVGTMCIKYYTKHQLAPGAALPSLFEKWAEGCKDQETMRMVERFLENLSDQAERDGDVNPDHLVDLAGEHFNRVKIRRLIDDLQSHVDAGHMDLAEKAITSFQRVELGLGSGIDLFLDKEAVEATFVSVQEDPLISLEGGIGQFFRNMLERERFVVVQGVEKSAKSFWLSFLAWKGMTQRKKVAFFAIGDLTEQDMKERFITLAAQHPIRSYDGKWPYTVEIPTSITPPNYKEGEDPFKDFKIPTITKRKVKFEKPLDSQRAWEVCQKVMQDKVRSKKSYFRLSCHPNDSINIIQIKDIIQTWATHDWIPDIVVIDYADILSPINHRKDERDQINDTWKKLRSLCQEMHCLVITATQADAAAYEKYLMDKRNFSGDKRKNAHANGICCLNQTAQEKEQGIMRLNWPVKREGRNNSRRMCYVAGCLDLANPCMVSSF